MVLHCFVGEQKNCQLKKSNSNTVGLNFQMYIYIYNIYMLVGKGDENINAKIRTVVETILTT